MQIVELLIGALPFILLGLAAVFFALTFYPIRRDETSPFR